MPTRQYIHRNLYQTDRNTCESGCFRVASCCINPAAIGGTAFFGGRGGLLGTIAGVLIIQVLSTMVVLIGLEIETQFIIKGLVILAAVTLYGLAQKKDS